MGVAAEQGAMLSYPVRLEAGEGASVAAHWFAPDQAAAARWPRPTWIHATPGATESWRYFDMRVPGSEHDEYSFASYMTARGIGVVAVDQLGMNESVFPFDSELLTLELLAEANAQAADAVRRELTDGVADGGDAADDLLLCGVGHSGGGGVTIIQQARHRSFDLVAILGMPADDFEIVGGQDELRAAMRFDDRGFFSFAELTATARDANFGPDVPDDVVAAFLESLPTPPSHLTMMAPGTLAPYARTIDTPVFLGFGEVDLARTPLSEPSRYPATGDVSLSIHPGCRHIHWAGPRRAEMWAALANWLWSRARYAT